MKRSFNKVYVKKKGFTLIEILITLSLIGITAYITFIPINLVKNNIFNAEVKHCKTSIFSLVSFSSEYCKGNQKNGYIQLEKKANKISFSVDNKIVKVMIIPKEYKLTGGRLDNILHVGKDGTVQPGTISLKDSKGKEHSITIQVGNFYAEIK
ncbi:type II secretion system protein [Clostridium algidicarnis]|uniref:type II secretion system protein n=1 Tax=Clostridium algidicarnis TaxID=37659 RepID=UPI001C0B73D8|nr:type II secretion system protein [Clostridium algidicarnis]MBU3208439.1 type II secretion system GspH family protein [Clostridium algidicarnis]MBU3226965.1 type II secretion system GspH family protein [Clostridium algidicarnis]MBU3250124.1 type II secretion system GspH family protein [Clostridium algidicarnis]